MDQKEQIYYAGIGSRETPTNIIKLFEKVGSFLSMEGLILRSGHAKGADQAFERGSDIVKGKKEIYLPWSGFEFSSSKLVVTNPKAFEIAKKFHPYWDNLKQGAQKLQARNSHQVLGEDLETYSKFIVCWTLNGIGSGGTGQAIRISEAYGIPVFDAGFYTDYDVMLKALNQFLIDNIKRM